MSPPASARPDRDALAVAAGTAAAAVAYLVTTAGRVGLVYYLPTQHRWALAAPDGVVAMDWFARAAWTLAACALGALAGWWLCPDNPRRAARVTRSVWGVGVLLLGWAALYTALWLFHAM